MNPTDNLVLLGNLDIDNLSSLLKSKGISDAATEILREEEISGSEFLDLTEENLTGTKMKLGQVKKLQKVQAVQIPQVS